MRPRVLIADDDAVSRLVLQRKVQALGYETRTAEDGRKALGIFQTESVPILLTDWMMPEMTGLELLRQIRASDSQQYTYAVMLTAREGTESLVEALDAGADDYLTKPVDGEQLRARLKVAERVLALQGEIQWLKRLLSICSYCSRIRDDDNTWVKADQYIARHTGTAFSHGICDGCFQERFGEEDDKR